MRRPVQGLRVLRSFTEPMTQAQLCIAADVCQAVVSRTLSKMMDESPRRAHIGDWRPAAKTGGPPIAVYFPGDGDDAPCTIPTLSGAERSARKRTRNRRSKDRITASWGLLTTNFFGQA